MIDRLRTLYRRLDRVQQTRWFRLATTAVVVILCGTIFGSLIFTTERIDDQRNTLIEAMTGQSLREQDDIAVTLLQTGTVTVDGRTYGGPRYKERPELIFDESGKIMVAGALADAMLRDQYPAWAPPWLLEQPGTTWLLGIVITLWLLLIVWMGLTLPFLITLVATAIPVAIALALDRRGAVWAFSGIGLLTFTFVLLTRSLLIAFGRPNQVLAVAHTVLKEASRTKIPLVFIVLVLVLLPLLPLGLDPASPLRFRLQTFISRGLGFTFYLAASMTIFLSCATVAFEFRDRQIWQLVTKPVGKMSYLLGKWLGVISVNAVIMVIAALSMFVFIQYLREQPTGTGMAGYEDAQQVRDAVLTARIGGLPRYERLETEQLRARVDELISRDPELALMPEVPIEIRRSLREQVLQAWAVGQRTIPPGGARTYNFSGLDVAKGEASNLTLRYRFHIMRDDEHETFPAVFFFNGDTETALQRTYVPTMSHVLAIPPEMIRDDGTLSVSIVNMYQPTRQSAMRGAGSLNFEIDDFELLYKAGSFEGNFFRAIFVDWVKLSFLAMLGICCATFLSFPVACLMAFTIFISGTIGPFLADSLEQYYPPPLESVDWSNVGMVITWAFMSVIRAVAQVIVFLLESFGEFRPTQLLVEGRLIPLSGMIVGTFKVGIVWSGVALVIGYFVMRSRQLAIYSGHG